MDQSYRRAEALPHIVQALRAAIVIGGDRRAEALPHIVQALRAGINQASLRQVDGDGHHSPAGAFTPSERASARLQESRKGLQPAPRATKTRPEARNGDLIDATQSWT